MNHGLQYAIREQMKRGFYILVVHDHGSNECDRTVTNGEDDVMSIGASTIKSMLKKGVIKEVPVHPHCLQLSMEKYVLV